MGATIAIKGDIAGKGDVVVSGTVEGSIDLADHRVTVEATGRVKGDIVGKQVQIKGRVIGDIEASDLLSVSSTGTVKGNIVAPRVAVEDGAKCECRIDMNFGGGRDAQSATSLPKK